MTAESVHGAALLVDLEDASAPDAIDALLKMKPRRKPAALIVLLPVHDASLMVQSDEGPLSSSRDSPCRALVDSDICVSRMNT